MMMMMTTTRTMEIVDIILNIYLHFRFLPNVQLNPIETDTKELSAIVKSPLSLARRRLVIKLLAV